MLKPALRYFFLILITSAAPIVIAQSWPLHITIDRNQAFVSSGDVIVALFNSEQNFLIEPLLKRVEAIEGRDKIVVTFDGLVQGEYAVSVIFDEDSNGELNRNKRGMPLEAAGFSQNPKSRFGPPSFAAAAFQHIGPTTQQIILHRWVKK